MIDNSIIFYITAFIIILFTIITMFIENIVYSLLSVIVVFFASAIIFFILGSEYNAIIQVAIYGLAVPIIIGLSIMFSGSSDKSKNIREKHFKLPYTLSLATGVFILAFVYLIMISLMMLPDTFNLKQIYQINPYEIMSAFTKGIFVNYVYAFELLSLLLTITAAGMAMISRRKKELKK